MERVEENDAVGTEDHLRPGRPETRRHLDAHAGHDGLGGQREIRLALDGDERPDAPLQAEARHIGVTVAPEARVVAAHGQHELAAVRAAEPDHECEAAGQPHVAVQQPRVVGELGLHPQHAFLGREACDQAELDRQEGHLRSRQGQPRQAEQRDFEPVADLHRDHGHPIDQREARERHPGREPERTPRHREDVAEADQLGHRVVGRPRGGVERLDEREVAEVREVHRQQQLAVDAQAATDAGEEKRRRPADRPVDRAEGEEGRELLAVLHTLPVAAEDRQAIDRESAHQHADVLHVVAAAELAQAALDRQPAEVGAEGQARQIDSPAARIEHRGIGRDDKGELQVIDRGGQAEQRNAPIHQQRDALQLVLPHRDAETDLLDVDRAETTLDRQPPRAVAVARAQADQHRPGAVFLHRERGAEHRRQSLRARAGVAHQPLRDTVATTGAADAAGEG